MVNTARDTVETFNSPSAMQPITIVSKGSARAAYRVVPDPDDPVILVIESYLCRVVDISASGFSCRSSEVSAGQRYTFKLDLPITGPELEGMVDVLPGGSDESGVDPDSLHCRFVDLNMYCHARKRLFEALRAVTGYVKAWSVEVSVLSRQAAKPLTTLTAEPAQATPLFVSRVQIVTATTTASLS